MDKGTCTAAACKRPAKSKGLCTMHYTRLRRSGRTDLVEYVVWYPTVATELQRIEFGSPVLPSRIWDRMSVTESGCWVWAGHHEKGGYGKVSVGRQGEAKGWTMHRLTYTVFVGPIPDGKFLDHFLYPDEGCAGPGCCKPNHVRPVTTRENVLRGDTIVAANRAKTHCPRGHAYAGVNLVIAKNGGRVCRTCKAAGLRAYRQRLKAVERNKAS